MIKHKEFVRKTVPCPLCNVHQSATFRFDELQAGGRCNSCGELVIFKRERDVGFLNRLHAMEDEMC